MKTLSMEFTAALTILLLGCPSCSDAGSGVADGESPGTAESVVGAHQGSQQPLVGIPNDVYPLPVDLVLEVQNPEVCGIWGINLTGYDWSQPPRRVGVSVAYYVEPDVLLGGGRRLDTGESYEYEFPSTQPFIDLLNYIGQHPDVLFDYSEFEGANPGRVNPLEDAEEEFHLNLTAVRAEHEYYSIGKGVYPGEETPEEIQYVIDTIKTEFMDVLLQHPYEPQTGMVGE